MAISVSVEDVRLIFETSMSNSQVQSFIDTAKRLVNDRFASAGVSDGILNDIVKYLSAHLGSTVTPSTLREKIGRDYDMWRTGEFKDGLRSTMYGQAVLTLDPTGILVSSGQKKISFAVVTRSEN